MHYLYRPTQVEELIVRGRYDFYDCSGSKWGIEHWERYRNRGETIQTWRSQWHDLRQGLALLTHSVVSADGIERLKLRVKHQGQAVHNLTLTPMFDSILIHDDKEIKELALPPYYGFVTELPSLARFAFPFDLASEQREAMTFLLHLQSHTGRLDYRLTKFVYLPLGLQDLTVKGQMVRCKGWRMDVPGLPSQEGWFDRHGTCLLWRVHQGSYEARLTEWLTFA